MPRCSWPETRSTKRVARSRFASLPATSEGIRMPLNAVFTELRAIMAPYAARLDAKKDDATELYLDTRYLQKNKKPLFFGAVQIKNSYVSFHLMPVYTRPELLQGLSAGLKSRMQGKSCFNFSAVDKPLFKELAALPRPALPATKSRVLCNNKSRVRPHRAQKRADGGGTDLRGVKP